MARNRRRPFSVPRGRPEFQGRSLFRSGRRNASQKLGYLKNRGVPPPLIERLRPFADQARGRDLEWFARQLSESLHQAGPNLNQMMALEAQMLDEFPAVLDWLLAQRPNYSGMSWRGARQRSDAWHAAMADKRPRKKRMRSRDVVMELPDKWAWVSVPLNEYKDEGELMGHCLNQATAHYRKRKAYSLRDPWNRPHVTLTVDAQDPNQVQFKEAKGKGNASPPALPYSRMTLDFLETYPFGPRLISDTDLDRIVKQVYPDKVEALQVLRSLTPLDTIRNRVSASVEMEIPEYLRQRTIKKNYKLIPDMYGGDKVPVLLDRLVKERSPARMVEWSRTITARMDELIRLMGLPHDLLGRAMLQEEFKGSTGLDLPTLKRKARSVRVRDRVAAAALLPPNSLGVLARDLSPAVWNIAATRAGANVAALFLQEDFRRGKVTPRQREALSPLFPDLIWKMSPKSFARRWHQTSSGPPRGLPPDPESVWGRFYLTALERAVDLGVVNLKKTDPDNIGDIDLAQFIAQIAPFDQTKRWVERVWALWEELEDGFGACAEEMFNDETLGKFLAADPAGTVHYVYGIDSFDVSVTWFYGRPKTAKSAARWIIGDYSPLVDNAWETGFAVLGDQDAVCSTYLSFYKTLRLAGHSPSRAAGRIEGLAGEGSTMADPDDQVEPLVAAVRECLPRFESAYQEQVQFYKENGKRLTL